MTNHLIRFMTAAEFSILPEMIGYQDAEGAITVPSGYCGYVIYGPYWPRPAGLYVVQPEISADDDTEIGSLELCDNGVVLASQPLARTSMMSARLQSVAGLEIRIKANGTSFKLHRVLIAQLLWSEFSQERLPRGETSANLDALDSILGASAAQGSPDAFAPFLNTPSGSRYDQIWEALTNSAEPGVVERLAHALPFDGGFETWLSNRPSATVVDAWGSHLRTNAEIFADLGMDATFLRLAGSASWDLELALARSLRENSTVEWFETQKKALQWDAISPWLKGLTDIQGEFNASCAVSGTVFLICPFTGVALSSCHCLPIAPINQKQVFLFYKFCSTQTFYLITSGFHASKSYLYFPMSNLILRIGSPVYEWGDVKEAIREFIRMVLLRSVQVSLYFTKRTTRAVLTATLDNIVHYFWNELSGLIDFEKRGLLCSTKKIISYKHRFTNPSDVFDENYIHSLVSCNSPEELLNYVIDNSLFIYRPTASRVTSSVARRIGEIALDHVSPVQRTAIRKAKAGGYILWVALRVHNKVWLEQVDGLIAVIRDARSEGPLSIFVDGTSDCHSLLIELHKRVPDDVHVYSGLGISVYETIAWANVIDAYVATIGSGLVFTTWLAAKPGIAHSETHHLGQMSFWSEVRSDAPSPLVPRREDIHDTTPDGYCDYHIDPDVMVRLFRSLPRPDRLIDQ